MKNQTKLWGNTTNLIMTDKLQIELLQIDAGGYCSLHRHVNKFNLFAVIEGTLSVFVEQDNNEQLHRLGEDHEILIVPPLMWHMFANTSKEPVVCVEMYWRRNKQVLVEQKDIERLSEGGTWDFQ